MSERFEWSGRLDHEDGPDGARWHQMIQTGRHSGAGSALVGFACDLGVQANKGRTGAVDGPDAIRTALANLAWHSETMVADKGTIACSENLDQTQSEYAKAVSSALNEHHFVIALGGGHEIAWGSYQGLRDYVDDTETRVGVINFDAHFDLRVPSPSASSGTPFWQIAEDCKRSGRAFDYCCLGVAQASNTRALFKRADELGCQYLLDNEFHVAAAQAMLKPILERNDVLYLTVCLDVFPAAFAPGVSSPAALGIPVADVIELINWIGSQQQKLGFSWPLADIAEMNPKFDQDQRTAKLAARLVHEMHKAKHSA